jgi:hypothetical protein
MLAGAGSNPLAVSGPVYLTAPYDGAPFGLSVVANAVVGPFNLGTAVVRSRILINPETLQLTIVSNPFPAIMGGVPLRVRAVNVALTRPDFIINPTTCPEQSIGATVQAVGGATATVSTPFAVEGCDALPFSPKLSASSKAGGSIRGDGASLTVHVVNPARSTGRLRAAAIELPKQIRPRLSTIQQACLPAAGSSLGMCPATAVVGSADVSSPILSGNLVGPVYLVAHGGDALPSLVMELAGGGLNAHLEASLTISPGGAITAAFKHLPDVEIASLTLLLPSGPHSLLGATESLCHKTVGLHYKLTEQNGAALSSTARIGVSGCASHAAARRAVARRTRR